MKDKKIILLGLVLAIFVFSGAAMAADPNGNNANDSTTVVATGTTGMVANPLTTKYYVDSGLKYVYDQLSTSTGNNASNISSIQGDISDIQDDISDIETDVSGIKDDIGTMGNLGVTVDDGNGGTTTADNLVDAINAVNAKADAASGAANSYTAANGVQIDANKEITLKGVPDDNVTNNKMYVFKNGEFQEMPVINQWDSNVLTSGN